MFCFIIRIQMSIQNAIYLSTDKRKENERTEPKRNREPKKEELLLKLKTTGIWLPYWGREVSIFFLLGLYLGTEFDYVEAKKEI